MESLHIVWVKRVSGDRQQFARVQLYDGRLVRVPVALAVWGGFIAEEDIVQTTVNGAYDYWHKDCFPKKKERSIMLYRDLSKYDAEEDMALVRKFVRIHYYKKPGRFGKLSEDQLNNLDSEVYFRMCHNHVYERCASESNYAAYLDRSVEHAMADIKRTLKNNPDFYASSLNAPVKGVDGGTLEKVDLLVSNLHPDLIEELQRNALYASFQARVFELDHIRVLEFNNKGKKKVLGTGLKGFTFQVIFDALVNDDLEGMYAKYQYPRPLMERYVEYLRKDLRIVADRFSA